MLIIKIQETTLQSISVSVNIFIKLIFLRSFIHKKILAHKILLLYNYTLKPRFPHNFPKPCRFSTTSNQIEQTSLSPSAPIPAHHSPFASLPHPPTSSTHPLYYYYILLRSLTSGLFLSLSLSISLSLALSSTMINLSRACACSTHPLRALARDYTL